MAPLKDEGFGSLILYVYVRKEGDGGNEGRVNSGKKVDKTQNKK